MGVLGRRAGCVCEGVEAVLGPLRINQDSLHIFYFPSNSCSDFGTFSILEVPTEGLDAARLDDFGKQSQFLLGVEVVSLLGLLLLHHLRIRVHLLNFLFSSLWLEKGADGLLLGGALAFTVCCGLGCSLLLVLLFFLSDPGHDNVEDAHVVLESGRVELLVSPESPLVLASLRTEDHRLAALARDEPLQCLLSDPLTRRIVLHIVSVSRLLRVLLLRSRVFGEVSSQVFNANVCLFVGPLAELHLFFYHGAGCL